MKRVLLTLGLVVGAACVAGQAEAQNYPWCAIYSGRGGGAQNCGFVSFQQCMATVSGVGGFCNRNTLYDSAAPRPYHRSWHRRHRHY